MTDQDFSDEIKSELRGTLADGEQPPPLDPVKVIAGARRRRRIRGLATAGLASVTVGAVAAGGLLAAANSPGGTEPAGAGFAGAPAATSSATAKAKLAMKNGYRFHNQPRAIGRLAPGQRITIAKYFTFETRGTTWAVTSHLPGESAYQPFGWRATVGNRNLGSPSEPTPAGSGSKEGLLFTSVFKNDKVVTVVYTRGSEAWYGTIYRLDGIPGWSQSSADMRGEHYLPGKVGPEDPRQPVVAVFAYDKSGKLLSQFPAKVRDPLAK